MKPQFTNDFYTRTIVASDDYTFRLILDVCRGNKWRYSIQDDTFTFEDGIYQRVIGVLNWHINHREEFERNLPLQPPPAQQTPDEELEHYALKRIKICRQCEHYKMFICTQCGCFMPAKTRLKGAECPKQFWLKEV